jgi:hypothetical protein
MVDELTNKLSFILTTKHDNVEVNISDAVKLWTVEPSILFQTGYRIAGTPEDIEALLSTVETPETIQEVIETSITSENYTKEFSSYYQEELEAYEELYALTCKSKKSKPASVTPVRSRGRTIEPLDKKLEKLPADKVLDVSNLKENGSGTGAISLGVRSKKYGTSNLRMVSNNLDSYLLAIEMLGGEETYPDDIAEIKEKFESLAIQIPNKPVSNLDSSLNPLKVPTKIANNINIPKASSNDNYQPTKTQNKRGKQTTNTTKNKNSRKEPTIRQDEEIDDSDEDIEDEDIDDERQVLSTVNLLPPHIPLSQKPKKRV